ncbi:DivIVA domain-containing protein [Pseudoclavibacter terrae]|uniref:DivIVA domain-containing protein n=1 Tax=Pseudoclavibacter terrae TaxID=1530195 RepID=A0A7J5B6C6_9MICO|nr:DivIVA domain-containing protein [Pseudoclavibacter terrae]
MRHRRSNVRSEDVRTKRFNALKFDGCYDVQEVDQFLDQAAATLEAFESGRPEEAQIAGAHEVEAVKFTSRVYERGYSAQEVDVFLEELADAIARYKRSEPATDAQGA